MLIGTVLLVFALAGLVVLLMRARRDR